MVRGFKHLMFSAAEYTGEGGTSSGIVHVFVLVNCS